MGCWRLGGGLGESLASLSVFRAVVMCSTRGLSTFGVCLCTAVHQGPAATEGASQPPGRVDGDGTVLGVRSSGPCAPAQSLPIVARWLVRVDNKVWLLWMGGPAGIVSEAIFPQSRGSRGLFHACRSSDLGLRLIRRSWRAPGNRGMIPCDVEGEGGIYPDRGLRGAGTEECVCEVNR